MEEKAARDWGYYQIDWMPIESIIGNKNGISVTILK